MRNNIKLIQIKWEEEESSYKKEKMMKCNSKVESSGEVKRQRGKGKIEGSVTVGVADFLLNAPILTYPLT